MSSDDQSTLDRLLAEIRTLEGRTKTHGGLRKTVKSWHTLAEIACARLSINPLYGQRLVEEWERSVERRKAA